MPVLPEVGSTSTPRPGRDLAAAPPARRSSTTPMRSLTLAIGLKNSSLASRLALDALLRGEPVEAHQRRVADRVGDRIRRCGRVPASSSSSCGFALRRSGVVASPRRAIIAQIDRTLYMETRASTISDREIAAAFSSSSTCALSARFAEILDGDRVEIGQERLAGLAHGWARSPSPPGCECDADFVGIGGAEADRGAHDLAERDAAALARQFVAAARAAHALEDLGVDEALQQRLQMARRQAMARGERLGGDRRGARMQGDVDDGARSRAGCAGTADSFSFSLTCATCRPVDPKPFSPRAVPRSSPLSLSATRSTRRDDELGDSRAPRDDKRLAPVIDQHDADFPAIVGVDGARRC